MTTVAQVVDSVLQRLGVLGATESSDASDAALVLARMVTMLDAWQLEPRAIVGTTEILYTPTLGQQSFTIGPAGDVAGKQPMRIELSSYYRRNGVDTPIGVGTVEAYNATAAKDVTGSPEFVALVRGDDTATVYVYPAGDGVSQLRLVVLQEPVTSFDGLTLADALTLPAGMRAAIEWSLADECLGEFDVRPNKVALIKAKAKEYRRNYKRANTRIPELLMPHGVASGGSFDIYRG
jgi:hypothetical protein